MGVGGVVAERGQIPIPAARTVSVLKLVHCFFHYDTDTDTRTCTHITKKPGLCARFG